MSARQWQDLRQAARLARSEGVTVTWRRDGTIILAPAPIKDSLGAAGTQQHNRKPEKSKETTHDSSTPQPAVTRGNERATPSKKQQRDADRAEAHRALKASPPMARWKLLGPAPALDCTQGHLQRSLDGLDALSDTRGTAGSAAKAARPAVARMDSAAD